ncbi:acyltransferase family protein [Clostridium sp. YIM B02505]|uniref:Acyltransferase family protein n=1 Tax=Clostridium yunnanense TaxID=2800325 RepID=A0ABS1EM86_9CLOT|nr:acyltransferase family protein [Clostridium yunnanense]MBK1810470.1 acyltransferase family protein [Clostridium yunnanense]
MENTKKTYDSVNIMRMVCAILVIVIHTSAFYSLGKVPGAIFSNVIARIAVPFFFITTGYFFYEKYNREGYVKSYIKRILIYYLGFSVAYTVFVFNYIKQRNNTIEIAIKNILFNGVSGALWYLPALMLSILVVTLLLKKNWIKALVILSILAYVLGLLGDSYNGFITGTPLESIVNAYNSIFVYTRNGICFGVPFITLGILINKYKLNDRIKKAGMWVGLFSIVFALEAYYLITNNIPRDNNMYISLVVLVPFLFIGLLNHKKMISQRKSKLYRDMSLWIYCIHELFMMFIIMNLPKAATSTVIMFIIVTGLSIVTAYIAVRKKAPEYETYKKKETTKIVAILICSIIFIIVTNGKPAATETSGQINAALDLKIDEKAPSSNIVGPMWKVSNGGSNLYIYGSLGIGIGTKDMYPLSPKVEDAVKQSEGIVLEFEYDKIDGSERNRIFMLKAGDSFEKHLSKEAIDIYKGKLKEFKADYSKINKQLKAGYLPQDMVAAYNATYGKDGLKYTPDLYFFDEARKGKKNIILIGDMYKNFEDQINFPDEVVDAQVKLLKYFNRESVAKTEEALEEWKKGNIDEADNKMNNIYIVPSGEKETFDKLNIIVNKYNAGIKNKYIKEYTEKIDGYLKDKKNYFVVIPTNYLGGDEGIIKSLKEKGYNIEQIR